MSEYPYDLENDLENSERCVATIVSKLAKFGVRKSDVTASDVQDVHAAIDLILIVHTLEWLHAEEIVRSEGAMYSVSEDGFQSISVYMNCVLTSKGFSLLGQPFYSGSDKETVRSAVKKVSEGGKGYAKFGDLVGGILGGFTKSIANG